MEDYLDEEWVALMSEAKAIGLTIEEVSAFLVHNGKVSKQSNV